MKWSKGVSGNPDGARRHSVAPKLDPLRAALRKYLNAAPAKLQIDPTKDSTATCVAKRLLQKAALGDARSTERILEHTAASQAGGETYTIPSVPGDEGGLLAMVDSIYGIHRDKFYSVDKPDEESEPKALKESGL